MTTGQPASGFRYWAFISYSHTDASWGRWLHKALETWRVPRRLVGMPIAAGTVPARLSPIFRDRDELPTASDLGAAVEKALEQSWCLIVICSPESAQSRWVNEEVLAFQRLGRGDRIHCLIVDGGPDPAAPLCFPPSLEQAQSNTGNGKSEPIAADARRFADGRSHALLKLIAGILGIGYDTLVQRDQQRRHRNMFWITCASLALVVVLAVSTLVAVSSRHEAVDQRSHAEGLVEFMIGDLRNKLEPDGKLATLDAVGKEALAYYAAQKSEDLDAEGLARRARALIMIGQVYDLRGDLDDAFKVFEQAAESTAELLDREPENGKRVFDHAQSVYWVGYIAYRRGNAAVAEPALKNYKKLAEKLVAIDPENEDWQAEVGYANSNLGTLLFEEGRIEDAASIFSLELEAARQLARKKPNEFARQMRLAQAHAWLADVRRRQGRFEEAIANRNSEIDVHTRALVQNMNNNSAKEALSRSERKLAAIYLDLGEIGKSVEHLQQGLRLALELTNSDGENAQWSELTSGSFAELSIAQTYQGELAAAQSSSKSASEIANRLMGRDKQVLTWSINWVISQMAEAQLAAKVGDDAKALSLLQGVVKAICDQPAEQLRKWDRTRLLIRSLWLSAELNRGMQQQAEANALYLQIAELAETAPKDPSTQSARAIALLSLGRPAEAVPIIEWLRDIDYKEPEFISQLGLIGPIASDTRGPKEVSTVE